MAVGKSIASSSEAKFYKLKLKGGARFTQSERQSDGKYKEVGFTKIINGALKSVSLGEGEFEGNPIYSLKIQLKDNNLNELYFIDANVMTGLGRSLTSSILNLKELGKIMELSLYNKKYTDRNGKPALADGLGVFYDGESLRWKFNIADRTDQSGLPAVNNVKIQGKDALDSYERDMFLIEKLKEHLEILQEPEELEDMPSDIKSEPLKQEETETETQETETQETETKKQDEEISVEDLPF